jgi:putative membrane protein
MNMSENLLGQLLETLIYSIVGVIVFGLAFAIIEKVTPFSVRKEIEEDQNVALGIIMAGVIIGLSMIIAAAMT